MGNQGNELDQTSAAIKKARRLRGLIENKNITQNDL